MTVLSNDKRAMWRRRFTVLIISVILRYIVGWDWYKSIALAFLGYMALDVVMTLAGELYVPLIFVKTYPKSVKELKHSAKQYQYIVTEDKKDIYTPVYRFPLEDVTLTSYKYLGRTFVRVRKPFHKRKDS